MIKNDEVLIFKIAIRCKTIGDIYNAYQSFIAYSLMCNLGLGPEQGIPAPDKIKTQFEPGQVDSNGKMIYTDYVILFCYSAEASEELLTKKINCISLFLGGDGAANETKDIYFDFIERENENGKQQASTCN